MSNPNDALRILGIDPGSRLTGFGVIDVSRGRVSYVSSGVIRIPATPFPQRLGVISRGISEVIETYRPAVVAVEEVFLAKNPSSALKLGQARGAAITAAVLAELPVQEYATRLVKQAIAGTGAADKSQIQYMVSKLLKLSSEPSEDAADALAIAMCHYYHGRGKA